MPIRALALAFASAFAPAFALVSALTLWAAMLLPTAIVWPFLVHGRASRIVFGCFAYEINIAVTRYPERKLCITTGIRNGEVA